MKLLSFILSLYVFSLVTSPVLGTLDLLPESMCCQDFYSGENGQEQHNDQDDNGCTQMCNPFFSCKCSFGFIASHINNPLKPFSLFTAENSQYSQAISLQYIHSIWHPPKA